MKIAVISDIHSNIFALNKVIEDIHRSDIDTIICTGDMVGYLPYPNEVIRLIKGLKVLAVKGNHDRNIGELPVLTEEEFKQLNVEKIQESASALYTRYILKEAYIGYLRELPEEIVIKVGTYKLLFTHGSPRRIDEYMYEDGENINAIVDETDANVIVVGHTHLPYHIEVNGTHVINVGSVGKPKHGNANSIYTVIDVTKEGLNTEFVEVTYDVGKMVEGIKSNPYVSNQLIDLIENGK